MPSEFPVEPKYGYRLIVVRDGERVRLFTREVVIAGQWNDQLSESGLAMPGTFCAKFNGRRPPTLVSSVKGTNGWQNTAPTR